MRLLRAASIATLLVGLVLILTFAYGTWRGFAAQQQLNQQWQQQGMQDKIPLGAAPLDHKLLEHPVKGIDFAISVPKLKYFAAVREGIDSTILYSGPGHYPGTVWPGDQGSVGVAAHNEYWINFPLLKIGDEIDIQTRYGTFKYTMTGSSVVSPDNRTVLVSDAPGYHLVLTTCWPVWAGTFATPRYVIFAEQSSPRIVTQRPQLTP